MNKIWALVVLVALLFGGVTAVAQYGPPGGYGPPSHADGTMFQKLEGYGALGPDHEVMQHDENLFGQSIDIETGTLSFSVTDVSLPGNSDLPVAFSRSASSGDFSVVPHKLLGGLWQVDIPHIIFSVDQGTLGNTNRCTGTIDRRPSGVQIFTPGAGKRHINAKPSGMAIPSGLNVTKVTRDYWVVHCGLNVQGGGGQGFWVTATNGDLYKFDRMFRTPGQTYVTNGGATNIQQDNLVFYPSEVKDVNGNWVRYDYNSEGPTRIYSNDGRQIDITYETHTPYLGDPHLRITSVTANGRTWDYAYNASFLDTVTLPDGRFWSHWVYPMFYNKNFACSTARTGGTNGTVIMKHPDGVEARYKLRAVRNVLTGYQTGYQFETAEASVNPCTGPGYPFPKWSYSLGVVERKHTLSDGETRIWTYDYQQDPSAYGPTGNNQYSGNRTTVAPLNSPTIKRTVTDPEGDVTVYHVMRQLNELKGAIAKMERFDSSNLSAPVEVVDYEHDQMLSHVPWSGAGPVVPVGYNYTSLPTKVTTSRGPDEYVTENVYETNLNAAAFAHGQPHTVKASSNVASGVRETVTTFSNSLRSTNYILALPTRQTINGKIFTDLAYDSNGRLTSTNRFGSTWATFTYHNSGTQAGNVASVKDSLNKTTSFSSYKRGQPQSITRADNSTLSRVVDDNGWVTSETNARGITTGYAYDNMGRLTLIDKPNGWPDTNISYLNLGNGLVKTVTKGNQLARTVYNGMYELLLERTKTHSGSGGSIYQAFQYDKLGRRVFESLPTTTSPFTEGVTTSYDALGRVTQMTENVSPHATTSYEYLSQNRTRVTDPSGAQTTTKFQAYGTPSAEEAAQIIDPLGMTTTFTRNIFGQVLTLNQSGSQNGYSSNVTRNFYYDDRLRLCRHRAPEFGDELMAYNAKDQLVYASRGETSGTTCATPTSSLRTAFTYDALDRQTSINFPGSTPDISKTYDGNGNVTDINRGTTAWDYTYNDVDQLTNEELTIDGRVYSTGYIYDTSGLLSGKTLPQNGGTISFDPDAFGRITGIRNGGTHYVDNISYHANSIVSAATYGNGKSFSQSIDDRQLPNEIKVTGGGTHMHLSHAYDPRGKITAITNHAVAGENRTFGYDARGRLTTADGSWGTGSFKYDAVDNIRQKKLGSRTVDINYDAANRVSSVVDTVNGTRSWAYDNRGNVTDNGPNSLTYDWSNQPTAVSASGLSEAHTYDGNMRRAKTVRNGKTTYSVYSTLTGSLVYQDEITDNVKTHYLAGGGASVRLKNGVPEYTHLNHQGSAEVTTSSTGSVLWRESYTPFGEKLTDPAANRDDMGYTGHIQDDVSGLTYMQARYYDPIAGRFLSADPIGYADQTNLYAYVHNDPLSFIDPEGLECSHTISGGTNGSGNSSGGKISATCIVTVRANPNTGQISQSDLDEAKRIASAQAVAYAKAVKAEMMGLSQPVGPVGNEPGFSVSAASVAKSLGDRKTVYNPGRGQKSASGNEALMTASGGVFGAINVFDGVKKISYNQITAAFFHEAIHGTREETTVGPTNLHRSPNDAAHQLPYNKAAVEMWRNWGPAIRPNRVYK